MWACARELALSFFCDNQLLCSNKNIFFITFFFIASPYLSLSKVLRCEDKKEIGVLFMPILWNGSMRCVCMLFFIIGCEEDVRGKKAKQKKMGG